LIIVAFLKYPKIKTRINLGRILMEMLEVYGKFFNYAQTVIDVNMFR
jgi:DNA polymerase sigma